MSGQSFIPDSDEPDSPLHSLRMAHGQRANSEHAWLHDGASNLVTKAIRALEAGDEDRARRYIEHACRLPYDARERVHHGPWGARMNLFTQVTDALDEAAVGDDAWLNAAMLVLGRVDGVAWEDLASVLSVIAFTDGHGPLTGPESQRIKETIGGRRQEPDHGLTPESTPEEQFEVAWPVTRAAYLYHRAYDHGGVDLA